MHLNGPNTIWLTHIYSGTEAHLGVLDCGLDLEDFRLNPNAPWIPLTVIHRFTKGLCWKGFMQIVWCSLLLKAGPQIRLSLALSSWVFDIYSGGNSTTSLGNLFHLLCSLENCNENATGTAHLLTSFCLDEYCVVEAFNVGKPRPWWCFSLGCNSGSSLWNALPHVLNHLSFPRKTCCPKVADNWRCSDPGKTGSYS